MCAPVIAAQDPTAPREGRVGGLAYRLMPRTPEQIAAFYEARGFPPAAVAELARACLVTISLHNERSDVVWLELARWEFRDAQGRRVVRRTRAEWNARWETLAVPAANRSTFGWTQLPEVRDLQPGEPVGGNVVLEPPAGAFELVARFATRADRSGGELVLRVPGLRCPRAEGEGK